MATTWKTTSSWPCLSDREFSWYSMVCPSFQKAHKSTLAAPSAPFRSTRSLQPADFLYGYVAKRQEQLAGPDSGAQEPIIGRVAWAVLTRRLTDLVGRITAEQSVTPLLVSRF